jgi:hypothetical protein
MADTTLGSLAGRNLEMKTIKKELATNRDRSSHAFLIVYGEDQ